jgi:DNA polymerase-3 subunit gamma/tau
MIARAAEGSVRDALSLLDQAIAHSGARPGGETSSNTAAVGLADVQQMLGLADRTRVIGLFEALMKGDVATALAELRDQYDTGADPAVVLTDLAEFTHLVTRVKVVPAMADDPSLAEAERMQARGLAEKLSMRVLARTWQMLLKGIEEVQAAGRPVAAAEMVLVRIAYAADLPTPDELVRLIEGGSAPAGTPQSQTNGGGSGSGSGSGASVPRFEAPRSAPRALHGSAPIASSAARRESADPVERAASSQPAVVINDFAALVALAAERRDLVVKTALERDVRLVRCEDGRLEIALEANAPRTLVNDLARKFSQWTGRRWMVVVSAEQGQPTLHERRTERDAQIRQGVAANPLVTAVLERFPGAEITSVRGPEADQPPAATPVEPDAVPADTGFDDEGSSFGARAPHDDGNDDL